MLSGLELIISLAAVFIGSIVMGTVSFGFALVVAPVLILFLDPQSVVIIANFLIVILLVFVFIKVRSHLKLKEIKGLIVGGLSAVPIGVLALTITDPAVLRISIGLLILALGGLLLSNTEIGIARSKHAGLVFGFLASLCITSLSIGGPLAASYVIAQKQSSNTMRASLSFFFLVTYALAFLLYFITGLVATESLVNTGLLTPALIAGFLVANLIVNKVNETAFRYVAIGVIISGGLVLLVREIIAL